MNLKALRLSVLAVALVATSTAIAGAQSGPVVDIRIQVDKGLIYWSKPLNNSPCPNSRYSNALWFDLSTEGGKAMLWTALTAKITGNPITGYGTGTCNDIYGNQVEQASLVELVSASDSNNAGDNNGRDNVKTPLTGKKVCGDGVCCREDDVTGKCLKCASSRQKCPKYED